jgi:D-3-phosphoglycerate dehydrogenase / 2-oxoglutarate reductase
MAGSAAPERKRLKVLLLSQVPETALQVLTDAAGYEVDICTESLSEAQLARRIEDVSVVGLAAEHAEVLTDEIIRSAHRLLAIGCFSAQAAAVDVRCASEMGVPVFCSPYGDSHSRAETVIALLVLLARQLGDRNAEMHRADWQKVSDGCFEVRGKKLGILGYGHVGSQLGVLAEFLGLKVLWYDRQPLMPIGNRCACPAHTRGMWVATACDV